MYHSKRNATMKYTIVSRAMMALLFVLLASSFTYEIPAKKFTPVGTWAYSAPDVPEGYQQGKIVIVEDGNTYGVSMVLNEYYSAKGEKVTYSKKTIKFSVWVESQEVIVEGTFDGDEFTGTVSYSEGSFDLTAVRESE